MRIIYLHQYFNTPGQAGSTRSYDLAVRLVAAGHDVHMVTSSRDSGQQRKTWQRVSQDGINVHYLHVPYSNNMSFRQRLRAFFEFAVRTTIYATKLKGDVVYATSTPLTIILPAAYIARRHKIPLVFEVRDLWPEVPIALGVIRNPVIKYFSRLLERFAYRSAKEVVALSPGMRDGVVRQGYPAHRITIIPNGAELQRFQPKQAEQGRVLSQLRFEIRAPIAVYIGTIGIINGLCYLVDLASIALHSPTPMNYLVIGSGIEESKVRQYAAHKGVLNRNFIMLPRVPKEELPRILAEADIALSLVIDVEEAWANSANKFFDALAAGKPLAINYGGWQAELLASNGAGIQLPPEATEQAFTQLANRVYDEEWKQRAGQQARKLAEDEFDFDQLAHKLETVLQRVRRNSSK